MNMKKLDKLLEEFYDLGREDGFKEHQFECAEDNYDAECWVEDLEKIAEKYNIDTDGYDDSDPWDNASCLNYQIKKQIINEIKELIGENKYGIKEMAIDVIDNIYDDEFHKNEISIDAITREMHYFVGSLDFEDLLEAIKNLCEERNIKITEVC